MNSPALGSHVFIHMFVLDLEDCNQVREKKGLQLPFAYGKKSFLLAACDKLYISACGFKLNFDPGLTFL